MLEKKLFAEMEGMTEMPVLLCSIEEVKARSGTTYCNVVISDGAQKVEAKYWGTASELSYWEPGMVVVVELNKSLYNGKDSYKITVIKSYKGDYVASDFLLKAPRDIDEMFQELTEDIAPYPLVEKLLIQNEENFKFWAAAKSMHHNYYGGLLYHSWTMARNTKAVIQAVKAHKANWMTREEALTFIQRWLDKKSEDKASLRALVNEILKDSVKKRITDEALQRVILEMRLAQALLKPYEAITKFDVVVCAFLLIAAAETYNARKTPTGLTWEETFGKNMFPIMLIDSAVKATDVEYDADELMMLKHVILTQNNLSDENDAKAPAIPEAAMVSVIKAMVSEIDFFSQPLDEEAAITATALHDIAKLKEMETSFLGDAEYTPEGNLLGHLSMGVEMVYEAAMSDDLREFYANSETLWTIIHCIATHHRKVSWGALCEAKLQEAKLLFCIDYLDAKMEALRSSYNRINGGELDNSTMGVLRVAAYKPKYLGAVDTEEEK